MAKSSQEWVDYFRWNGSVAMRIPWHLGADLNDQEREAIAHSVQVFQLGESAEGRRFMKYAQQWAQLSDDPLYPEAIRLLITEEQRHSGVLGRFMEVNGIARIKRGCSDGIFRRLRNVVGSLETSIAVLVTAEIIAKVYYPALRNATQSEVLHAICQEVFREEIAHVEFQTEQLARIRVGRSMLAMCATRILHRVLFYPTVLIVGMSHRRVLRRGGLSAMTYWVQCRKMFLDALSAMEPGSGSIRRREPVDERTALAKGRTDRIDPNFGRC